MENRISGYISRVFTQQTEVWEFAFGPKDVKTMVLVGVFFAFLNRGHLDET